MCGCATSTRAPVDVALIPNDCANRHAIIAWLDGLKRAAPAPLQDLSEHENQQRSYRARIWHLRYHCQPAS